MHRFVDYCRPVLGVSVLDPFRKLCTCLCAIVRRTLWTPICGVVTKILRRYNADDELIEIIRSVGPDQVVTGIVVFAAGCAFFLVQFSLVWWLVRPRIVMLAPVAPFKSRERATFVKPLLVTTSFYGSSPRTLINTVRWPGDIGDSMVVIGDNGARTPTSTHRIEVCASVHFARKNGHHRNESTEIMCSTKLNSI
jgi:hypothetical protein